MLLWVHPLSSLFRLYCPTLAQGSKWHTIQIWVIDVFIIHIMSSSSRPEFHVRNFHPNKRYVSDKTSWYSIDASVNDRHIMRFYDKCHFCHLLPSAKLGQYRFGTKLPQTKMLCHRLWPDRSKFSLMPFSAMLCWEADGHYCHRHCTDHSPHLVINGLSLNSVNDLLALNWRYLHSHLWKSSDRLRVASMHVATQFLLIAVCML